MNFAKDSVEFYQENGYVKINGFLTTEEVDALKKDVLRILNETNVEKPGSFGSDMQRMGTQHHIDSINKTELWFESNAIDEKTGRVVVPIERAVHKIAHGVHLNSKVARSTTFSEKMKSLIKTFSQFEDPAVVQGMYLLKQPRIGGERLAHQDETYLNTDPEGKLIGAWIALDEATSENGCLQFIPGSHRRPVQRFHERLESPNDGLVLGYRGQADYMTDELDDQYVVVSAKPGDVILIHGKVVHKSEPNRSDKPRQTYTFHCFERANNVKWSDKNAFQETADFKFPRLYTTEPRPA